jgi:O-antigen/teichoic acid export membrane protein
MVLMFGLAIKSIGGIRRLHGRNWAFLQTHKHVILVFFLITLLTTLESQTDTLMLSAFHDETEVGWYGAATTLAYTLIMMSQAYRFAVYPLMSHYHTHTPAQVPGLYQQSLRFLGMLALPIVVGVTILAAPIVEFIFGPKFAPTTPILSILIFVFLLITLNEPTTRVLLVHDRQNTLISFLVVSVLVNVLLNFLLTPTYASIGAAVARVSSTAVLFFAGFLFVQRHYYPAPLHTLLLKSTLAALAMGIVVFLLKDAILIIPIAAGAISYIGLLFLLQELKPADLLSIYHAIGQRLATKPQN